MTKAIGAVKTDRFLLSVYKCKCGFYIGLDKRYLEQVDDVNVECPSCGKKTIVNFSNEEKTELNEPKDFKEAVNEVAKENVLSPEYVIENKLVVEIFYEDDCDGFITWHKEDGTELKKGSPIGYVMKDENIFTHYRGLKENSIF